MAGAGILSAKAAIRSGVAMVQLICTEELVPIYQQTCPEAMVFVIPKDPIKASEIIHLRAQQWANALLVGPGLGQAKETELILFDIIQKLNIPMVIDADGLNLLQRNPERLKQRPSSTVITPHPGEFKRLFKFAPAPAGYPLIEQCRELSQSLKLFLHLKGAPSLTACPDGKVLINGSGNSILSTAGSGDVLSGMTGAFLAQGQSPEHAISAAAFYHGCCADLLKHQGMLGHSAMDIVSMIPQVINE
jgi:NAD(P)H-hydrate epimerase